MEMIKFNYMLQIDILRNSSPKKVGVLRGAFEGFGCPKRHPDTLLAKTMTVCISSCSNCDLLHKIKVIPLTYMYMIINCKGALLKQKY